jgi:hypothetical protein
MPIFIRFYTTIFLELLSGWLHLALVLFKIARVTHYYL